VFPVCAQAKSLKVVPYLWILYRKTLAGESQFAQTFLHHFDLPAHFSRVERVAVIAYRLFDRILLILDRILLLPRGIQILLDL